VGAGLLHVRRVRGAVDVDVREEVGRWVETHDTWEQDARRLQTSLRFVERGVPAETCQLVSELRTHAARAKDGVVARVARPRVEKRRFRGCTCGLAHARDDTSAC
jgi:hypothetical protein